MRMMALVLAAALCSTAAFAQDKPPPAAAAAKPAAKQASRKLRLQNLNRSPRSCRHASTSTTPPRSG